jgi:hypothetical protein
MQASEAGGCRCPPVLPIDRAPTLPGIFLFRQIYATNNLGCLRCYVWKRKLTERIYLQASYGIGIEVPPGTGNDFR